MEKSRKPPDHVRCMPAEAGAQPKIIRMFRSHTDLMEPAKFKINQKIPGKPRVIHTPAREITVEESGTDVDATSSTRDSSSRRLRPDSEDVEGERERMRIREERHRERVRNANLEAVAPNNKRTNLDRQHERDTSEQIALGMARPNTVDNDAHDQRLYNQSQGLDAGFAVEDVFNVKSFFRNAKYNVNKSLQKEAHPSLIFLIMILQVLLFATHAHTAIDSSTPLTTTTTTMTTTTSSRNQQQQEQLSRLLVYGTHNTSELTGSGNSSSMAQDGEEQEHDEDQEPDAATYSTADSYSYTKPSDKHNRLLVRQVKANLLRCLELEEEPSPARKQADIQIPPELIAQYLNQREQMRNIVPSDEDFYGQLPRAHPLVKRHADGGSQSGPRQRNSANNRKQQRYGRIPDKCSKRNMKIKFEDVGWSDWIIAPTSFNAYYCAGECSYPMSDYQNATNHAIIQSIYHSVGRVVPRSCCAPIKMGIAAILFQLDGHVQMRQYSDMVVEACGCL